VGLRSAFERKCMLEIPSKYRARRQVRHAPVLHRGHAAYILVESVEKPTDNRLVSLLRCGAMDADSFGNDQPVVGPAHFPTLPPPRAWACGYFDGSTRSPC
jgi:hypothetical protein